MRRHPLYNAMGAEQLSKLKDSMLHTKSPVNRKGSEDLMEQVRKKQAQRADALKRQKTKMLTTSIREESDESSEIDSSSLDDSSQSTVNKKGRTSPKPPVPAR